MRRRVQRCGHCKAPLNPTGPTAHKDTCPLSPVRIDASRRCHCGEPARYKDRRGRSVCGLHRS